MKILFSHVLLFIFCIFFSCTNDNKRIDIEKIDEYYTKQKDSILTEMEVYENFNYDLINCLSKKEDYKRITSLLVFDSTDIELRTSGIPVEDIFLENCIANISFKKIYKQKGPFSCKVDFSADSSILNEIDYLIFIDDINPFSLHLKYSNIELNEVNNTKMRRELVKPHWYFELLYKF